MCEMIVLVFQGKKELTTRFIGKVDSLMKFRNGEIEKGARTSYHIKFIKGVYVWQ